MILLLVPRFSTTVTMATNCMALGTELVAMTEFGREMHLHANVRV